MMAAGGMAIRKVIPKPRAVAGKAGAADAAVGVTAMTTMTTVAAAAVAAGAKARVKAVGSAIPAGMRKQHAADGKTAIKRSLAPGALQLPGRGGRVRPKPAATGALSC